MPPIETMEMHDRAVMWESAGVNSYNDEVVKPPVEIPARWEAKRRQTVTAEGTAVGLDAQVVLDRAVPSGSIVRKGRLCDVPAGDSPGSLYRVETLQEDPDLKGRNVRRVAGLTRFHDKLPPLAGA